MSKSYVIRISSKSFKHLTRKEVKELKRINEKVTRMNANKFRDVLRSISKAVDDIKW